MLRYLSIFTRLLQGKMLPFPPDGPVLMRHRRAARLEFNFLVADWVYDRKLVREHLNALFLSHSPVLLPLSPPLLHHWGRALNISYPNMPPTVGMESMVQSVKAVHTLTKLDAMLICIAKSSKGPGYHRWICPLPSWKSHTMQMSWSSKAQAYSLPWCYSELEPLTDTAWTIPFQPPAEFLTRQGWS